jgi:hypothetical protein
MKAKSLRGDGTSGAMNELFRMALRVSWGRGVRYGRQLLRIIVMLVLGGCFLVAPLLTLIPENLDSEKCWIRVGIKRYRGSRTTSLSRMAR